MTGHGGCCKRKQGPGRSQQMADTRQNAAAAQAMDKGAARQKAVVVVAYARAPASAFRWRGRVGDPEATQPPSALSTTLLA